MPENLRHGTYRMCSGAGEPFRAFVPHPLPPNPPLALGIDDWDLLEKANRALGQLEGMVRLLPDSSRLLHQYVRKEALVSSQIEGTQSSFSDVVLFEGHEQPQIQIEDVEEVANYINAMNHGLSRLREGFPLSLRLLKEIHQVLLSRGRGADKDPGNFRRSQNWIGGSRPGNAFHVPPPPDAVDECMGQLEFFLHDRPQRTPLLIKAGLAHVQFESIHPFLDGNGRLGRLLITFLLCAEGALSEPLLYLSLFFKTHRSDYYRMLNRVRTDGDWEGWIRFFLQGVHQTASQAADTAEKILRLFNDDQQRISTLGRAASSAMQVYKHLQLNPISSATETASVIQLTEPTVRSSLTHLQKLRIVKETTGQQRHRLFVYDQYMTILSEGTDPLPARS